MRRNQKNDSNKQPSQQSQSQSPEPVLIPPSFGVGPADRLPLTLSASDALQASFFPVLWKHVQYSDLSYRLLNDHLQSGFWWNWANAQSNISTSMVLNNKSGGQNNNNNNNKLQTGAGRMVGERRLSDSWIAQLRGGTDGVPSVILTHWSLIPGLVFKGAANSQGQAWVSSILFYSNNTSTGASSTSSTSTNNSGNNSNTATTTSKLPVDMRAVTWLPLNFQQKTTVQDVLQDVPYVNVFGAVRIANLTAAVESQIPTSSHMPSSTKKAAWNANNTKYYGTLNLVDEDDTAPPLQVTLQHTPDYSSLALSQVFTIDRFQFNPWEDRANRVRNTVGWTVQMQHLHTNNNNDGHDNVIHNTNNHSNKTQVAVAGAWQVNRTLALKVVARPTGLDLAVVVKRWRQPRITCSLLARHEWQQGRTGLLGLGLELETGRSSSSSNAEDTFYPDNGTTQALRNERPAPETKLG